MIIIFDAYVLGGVGAREATTRAVKHMAKETNQEIKENTNARNTLPSPPQDTGQDAEKKVKCLDASLLKELKS